MSKSGILYKLKLIKQSRMEIMQALNDKGINVEPEIPFSEYAEYIKKIMRTTIIGLGTQCGIKPYIKAPSVENNLQTVINGVGTQCGIKPYIKAPAAKNNLQTTVKGLRTGSSAVKG